jgi:hypothetical protein
MQPVNLEFSKYFVRIALYVLIRSKKDLISKKELSKRFECHIVTVNGHFKKYGEISEKSP